MVLWVVNTIVKQIAVFVCFSLGGAIDAKFYPVTNKKTQGRGRADGARSTRI